ncbi:hypothetical protein [Lederbergia panacisoli]|uniref:hypothetical protein n=1 Tax=Lederbergia panacisoli TaxID=1255251 RepID=UPI00214AA00C|nr:hypothetical protein [Lederbergia panacisoli]MCR2823598.1 hypothetical protein [Lederbergia panacisoli]
MNSVNDEIIASITYIKVKRTIEFNQQKYTKTEHSIDLYKNKISTSNHQFKNENVFDVTYKGFSDNFGFLYLHTNQGVFAFEVNTDPYHFVEKARHYIKRS